MTHESLQTVSKRSSSISLVLWTNDTHFPTQSGLLTFMSSYLLISKAHAYDNHLRKVEEIIFMPSRVEKVPFTWRLSGQKNEYNLPLERKYLYVKGAVCRALQYAGLSLFFLRGSYGGRGPFFIDYVAP